MNPISIIRRIDDLGRIVIPKEIRNNWDLNDGDALEIVTNYNGKEIVIRPYKKSWEGKAAAFARAIDEPINKLVGWED